MAPISVGSVAVDVVPSARNFSRELQAQLADQQVTVNARLEDKGVNAELAELGRDRAMRLGVDVDDRQAEAKLREVTRPRTVKVKVDDGGSIKKAEQQSVGLLSTLALLAPAAAPLVGVAAGGAAALGALGVTGILALKGIEAEMAKGTPLGLEYSGMLGTLKGDLGSLEQTAASGVLAGFTESATEAHAAVPGLRSEVGLLSKSLGSDLGPATEGVLGLMNDLQPVVNELAMDGHQLAVEFDGWANGPGGRAFAAYLAEELPKVEATLEAIFGAGSHVVQALLPLGGPVLDGITGIADAIHTIPTPIITDLFVAFAGYKSVVLANSATAAFSKILDTLGVTAGRTTVDLDALAASETAAARAGGGGGQSKAAKGIGTQLVGKAASALGPVGAIAVAGLAGGALADQLLTNHGKSLDNSAANKIASGGPEAFTAAQSQLSGYRAELAKLTAQQLAAAQAGGQQESTALALTPKIEALSTKTRNLSVAVALANPLIKAQEAANKALGLTADGTRDAITGETVAMSTWVSENDKRVTAAQNAITANVDLRQAIADATKDLKTNGVGLDVNTAKGRENQLALLGVASATHNKIDADAAAHAGSKVANADFAEGANQLYRMARQFGLSSTAAQHYVDRLLGIPSDVTTTVHVNGIAASEAQIAALKRYEGSAQFYANQKQNGNQPNLPGKKKPGSNAAGTLDWPGGLTWVGEKGPELVALPPHTAVIPNHIAAVMANAAAMAQQASRSKMVPAAASNGPAVQVNQNGPVYSYDPTQLARAQMMQARKALAVAGIR